MIYATANRDDVPHVARVLMESFAEPIYRAYGGMPSSALFEHAAALARDVEPRAFIVARHERTVVGFVFAPHSLAALRRVSWLRGHVLRWLWQWPSGWRRIGCSPLQLLMPYMDRRFPVPSWQPPHEGRILSVAVVPSARGQRVGTLLLRHALTYLRHRNVRRVRVEIPSDDLRARRLLEGAGFTVVGRSGTIGTRFKAVSGRGSTADRLVMLYDFQGGEVASPPVVLHA